MDFSLFYASVEGWSKHKLYTEDLLDAIDAFQTTRNVKGAILEIGVHHGRFFIPMHNKLKSDELSYAIDLFENQEFNIDKSGYGNRAAFTKNLESFAEMPHKCRIIKADSLSLNSRNIRENYSVNDDCRLISLDGSHTVPATVNDLLLAQDLLVAGGVIFLDDYCNMHWPGSHIGLSKFFWMYEPKIAPFFYGWTKLLLCHVTWQRLYLDLFSELFKNREGFFIKIVDIHGYDVISAY